MSNAKSMTLRQLAKELQSQPELANQRPVICQLHDRITDVTYVYAVTEVDWDDGMTVLTIKELLL